MPGQFLHGVEVVELNGGPRPIRTVKSAVIGLVGTAPNADADKFSFYKVMILTNAKVDFQ